MGLFFDAALSALGGQRVGAQLTLDLPFGLGDDDGTLEDDFSAWRECVWPELMAALKMEDKTSNEAQPFALTYIVHKSGERKAKSMSTAKMDQALLKAVKAVVTVNRELHGAGSDRSCRHIELDLKGKGTQYSTGDHIAILPRNRPELVKQLAARVGVALDEEFTLHADTSVGSLETPFPCPTTVCHALTNYLDISGSVSKTMLRRLGQLAKDDSERATLLQLSSKAKEGSADMYDVEVQQERLNIVDVLNKFKSIDVTAAQLFELLPRLQVRYYSIASSDKVHPTTVAIVAVVDRDTMPSGKVFEGVCTTYLQQLPVGSSVEVFLRVSKFKLPKQLNCSVIMIGPGTGLAPFLGFLEELQWFQKRSAKAPGALPNLLLFGCRDENVDFIHRDTLEAAQVQGAMQLHTVFSRSGTPAPTSTRKYVQHLLLADLRDDVASRILDAKSPAHVYVCGGTKMASDVRNALVQIMAAPSHLNSHDAAVKQLADMQLKGRYLQDVWS